MASATEHRRLPRHNHCVNNISNFIQSTASNISSIFIPKSPNSSNSASSPPKVFLPFPASLPPVSLCDSSSSGMDSSSSVRSMATETTSSGFPSSVRISNLSSSANGGGPAFVGQVFSMCDLSGTGLMAVSTQFDIPFISNRRNGDVIVYPIYFLCGKSGRAYKIKNVK